MKNLNFRPNLLLSMIVAVVALALMLHACTKENPSPAGNQQAELTAGDLKISQAIQAFKVKMDYQKDNPGYKSGETMQMDSAIWYIDATINYYYSKANHPFARLHRDTSYIALSINIDMTAAYEDVVSAYDVTLTRLSESYYAIEGENKQFIMAQVDDAGTLPGNKRNLRFITITGTGTLSGNDFTEDEAYLYDHLADYDCYGDSAVGAPKIFEAYLNNFYNTNPNPAIHYYFIGLPTIVEFSYQEHQLNVPLTNYLDYKIFAAASDVAHITNDTKCLEWNQNGAEVHEMQFYYDYLKELIDEESLSQNSQNLYYAPSTMILSTEESNGNTHTIFMTPTIHFKKRLVAYSLVLEPAPID
jgi:hypothetical protein